MLISSFMHRSADDHLHPLTLMITGFRRQLHLRTWQQSSAKLPSARRQRDGKGDYLMYTAVGCLLWDCNHWSMQCSGLGGFLIALITEQMHSEMVKCVLDTRTSKPCGRNAVAGLL